MPGVQQPIAEDYVAGSPYLATAPTASQALPVAVGSLMHLFCSAASCARYMVIMATWNLVYGKG